MSKKVRLADIEEPVRTFIDDALTQGGITFEADDGTTRGGIVPYYEASPERRREALERLMEIQRKVRAGMEADGKTEEEFDAILQEDE